MSNSAGITDQRHNDYVGSDANIQRIPGADQATTGHHFIEVFPNDGPPKFNHMERASGVKRPDEHLPPPTGRDRPPRGVVELAEEGGPTERLTTLRPREPAPQSQGRAAPQPMAPAPGSRTVVDNDPWAEKTSAGDTLTGATSKDVYGGIGKPGAGMSSAEMHHDGQQHRKRGLQGTDQYGTGHALRNEDGVDLSGWKEE